MKKLFEVDFKNLFESMTLIIVGDVEIELVRKGKDPFVTIKARCLTDRPIKEQWTSSGPMPVEFYTDPEVLRLWVIATCLSAIHLSRGNLHGKDIGALHEYWHDTYVITDEPNRPFIVDDVIFIYIAKTQSYITTSVLFPSFVDTRSMLYTNRAKGSHQELKRRCGSFVDSHFRNLAISPIALTPADYGHLAQILIDQGWAVFYGVHYGYDYTEATGKAVLVRRDIYGHSLHRNVYQTTSSELIPFILRALLLGLRGKEIENLMNGTTVKGKHPLIRYIVIPAIGQQHIFSTDMKDIELDIVISTRVTITEIKTLLNKTWTETERLNKRLAYHPRRVEENPLEEPTVDKPRIEPFPKPEAAISTAPVMKISELPKTPEVTVTLQMHGATVDVTFRSKSPHAVFAAAQEYLASKAPVEVGDNPHKV